MKKNLIKIASIILSAIMLFSVINIVSFADDGKVYGPYEYQDITVKDGSWDRIKSASMNKFQKSFYNALNWLAGTILKPIYESCPAPASWKDISEFDDTYYLSGRENYVTEAAEGNCWRAGYGSRSIIPTDFEPGKYYIGRDLFTRLAEGINDDCRVRVTALDDNSGEGIVIFAAADSLGVTNTDTLLVRENVIRWAQEQDIKIAALNLSATHSHSAIDAQGVATEAIYKLLTGRVKNYLAPKYKEAFDFDITQDKNLENAENFKKFYINAVTEAVKDAIMDMKDGKLYYAKVDFDDYHVDKRDLIASEDLPDTAAFRFVPNDGSAGIYIANIACHPTTFGAGNGLFTGDYIYYMEQRIEEKTGDRFLFLQGASGQISKKDTGVDEDKLPEEERLGATTRNTGRTFADIILAAEDDMIELSPYINAKYTNFMFNPENILLALAVKLELVNNQIYTNGPGVKDTYIVIEEGYIELGGKVGFCLFPVELYPEVFYGPEIINNGDYQSVFWESTDWDYPVPSKLNPREGIDMFAVHLCNDSLGYCLTDNNFAFLGHIIGDGIADESLSLGKHTGSTIVSEFKKLMDSITVS